jgi:hypothetical protein
MLLSIPVSPFDTWNSEILFENLRIILLPAVLALTPLEEAPLPAVNCKGTESPG